MYLQSSNCPAFLLFCKVKKAGRQPQCVLAIVFSSTNFIPKCISVTTLSLFSWAFFSSKITACDCKKSIWVTVIIPVKVKKPIAQCHEKVSM